MLPPWQNESVIELSQTLCQSFQQILDRDLDNFPADPAALAQALYHAPYAVLAHDGGGDPKFTYANLTAQSLWETPWHDFIGMPSRYSAEPDLREVRSQMLERVRRDGYIDDYSGIRISKSGKRFELGSTIVWNLLNHNGEKCGQAATFNQWSHLK